MKFLKSLFSKPNPDQFFENFDARANGACIANGVLKKLEDYLLILFKAVPGKEYRYELVVGTGKVHSWTFQIEGDWKVICKPDTFKKTVDYEIQINQNLVLILEFPAHGNLETAAEFRQILARLIYQTKNLQPFTEADPSELDALIQYSEKDLVKVEASEAVLKVIDRLQTKNNCEFAVGGKLLQLNSLTKSDASVRTVCEEAVFAVISLPNYSFELTVFDESGAVVCKARLAKELTYFFDYKAALFLWTERQEKLAEVCRAFSMGADDLRTLENLFLQFFTETENKMSFEQFLGANKDDWAQFYRRRASTATGDEPKEVQRYKTDDEHLKVDFEAPLVDLQSSIRPKSTRDGRNISLLQGNTSRRIMTAREGNVDVYTFDNSEKDLDFLGKFPFDKDRQVTPNKMVLLDRHNRLVWTDQGDSDAIKLSDLGKGAVVRTFIPEKGTKVVDFSVVGGKIGVEAGSDLVYGLGAQDIHLMDPRDPNGIVQTKSYQSKVGFEKILAVSNKELAVASQDGSIRLFKDLSGNAKNVIPPYLQDKVRSMDASKDGLFLLVNCGRYLLLFLTSDDGVSGYQSSFKKDRKPAPRILRVHPAAITALGLTELSFLSARFDEHTNDYEKFIIAWNHQAYAIWSLTKVMRNEYSTKIVRQFSERVVGADFRYDDTDIITAFEDRIGYQKTKLDK
jgi:hypothetical protein